MNTSGPSHQGFFAEYSLWNDSTYYSSVSLPSIQFTRPVFEESIFLTPPSVEQSAVNKNVERDKQESKSGNPWFESYLKKSLRVVKRDDLYKDPELFYEGDEGFLDPVVEAVNGLKVNHETSNSEEVPAASTSRPRGRQTNTRGRKNLMQRRLEKALSQPAQIERGASMMQRMGWEGGGLGRAGDGIVDPIAPNALYAQNTFGLGSASPEVEPVPTPPKRPKPNLNKSYYKTNILLNILEFVKNDLQIELNFDASLRNNERKRIHQMIAALNGEEDPKQREDFDSMRQFDIVNEIHLRNAYILGTQSIGTPPARQICIYKEAPDYMFLVTPDDIRNPAAEEEESNPFLRSITKHMKTETNTLFDKLIRYFIEFATEDYTEFRFLGPYVMDEITVMNTFLGLISCLAKHEPDVKCPDELTKIFENDAKFSVDEDVNGYVAIKKLPTEMET